VCPDGHEGWRLDHAVREVQAPDPGTTRSACHDLEPRNPHVINIASPKL
jgi:hypothetical protein